ncbi:unnamed protein product [Oppiella nova]|uniref:AATF leucine zipper-containing domain-containing protein n=1 Tax=Oppiella nova TaxID=334625 RepID=A0A7R9QZ54_9ACAR|nr:unnamed protein product [Oppiella nova]CAG2179777.1 unnamed protein product [Oppiella nova]
MTSLSDQIASLINPLPSLTDPEDDIHTETSALNVLNTTTTDNSGGDQPLSASDLTRKARSHLWSLNERYSGIKVTRDVLTDWQSEDEHSDGSHEGKSGSDPELEDREFYSDNIRAPTASSEDLNSSFDSNESENENEEAVEELSDGQDVDEGSDGYINQFSNIDVNEDISKGIALKKQLLIWDNLLECRINVQKILMDSNRCPQFDCLSLLKEGLQEKEVNHSLRESSKAAFF